MHRVVAVAALAACFAVSTISAQSASTPEEFAQSYIAAMQTADWSTAAQLMHPDALAEFKTMFVPLVGMDKSGEVAQSLFGAADSAALANTPADSVFARFMTAITGASPDLWELMSGAQTEIIGHVLEGDTGIAHVVFRMHMTMDGITARKVDAMPVKRYEGQWRALLTGNIEGMAAAIAKALASGQ